MRICLCVSFWASNPSFVLNLLSISHFLRIYTYISFINPPATAFSQSSPLLSSQKSTFITLTNSFSSRVMACGMWSQGREKNTSTKHTQSTDKQEHKFLFQSHLSSFSVSHFILFFLHSIFFDFLFSAKTLWILFGNIWKRERLSKRHVLTWWTRHSPSRRKTTSL